MSFLPHESSVFVFCRSKSSQRLTSHDVHSNVYNYKSTFSVEIVPICKVASFCFISRGYCMKWVEFGFAKGGKIYCVCREMGRVYTHQASIAGSRYLEVVGGCWVEK